MLQTYGEVCQQISTWIESDTPFKITADEVFDLDKNFPALCTATLRDYMNAGLSPKDVFVSDEYIAKLMCIFLKKKEIKYDKRS